ncbi:TrbI/VirB10 family protein [Pseudomonas chlororaphis]|uniref:TrbI/VirB10 family protein n=1 Tax=Pseudomonas chlororaphis TaxID=587753 RepID=UPI002D79A808|nr:TrbI/VirB10 family protein [Pseudomonas chlororaphis]
MQNNESTETLSSEKSRGAFDLRASGKHKKQTPVKIYVLSGVFVLIFILGVIALWSHFIGNMSSSKPSVNESQAVADATLAPQTVEDTSMKQRKEEKLRELEEQRKKEEEAKKAEEAKKDPPKPPAGTAGGTARQGAADNSPQQTAKQRKLSNGVMLTSTLASDASVYAGGATVEGAGSERRPGPAVPPGASGESSDVPLESLGAAAGPSSRGNLNNLSGPDFYPTKATLAPPGKYLLRHNTYARCAVYPEIITEHPGIVDCRLTDPLYSADGSTVIAEAGARLDGVQTVAMSVGQASVFTAWTSIETTAGVRAQLDSLGAGPMGASGTKAWVDNHWEDRFGGAVMLTLFQDGLTALTTKSQSSGSGYTVNNTEQNVESMADKVLESTINIAPTGYILPGTVLTIIVARDIDFSSVYENR